MVALARRAMGILESARVRAASHRDDLVSTLEAAAADEDAAAALLAGTLVTPLRPPSAFEERGLRVLEGGGRAKARTRELAPASELRARAKRLERELAAARRGERSAGAAVERARRRLEELEVKRGEARETLRAAEAEHRGAKVEAQRLERAFAKLERAR